MFVESRERTKSFSIFLSTLSTFRKGGAKSGEEVGSKVGTEFGSTFLLLQWKVDVKVQSGSCSQVVSFHSRPWHYTQVFEYDSSVRSPRAGWQCITFVFRFHRTSCRDLVVIECSRCGTQTRELVWCSLWMTCCLLICIVERKNKKFLNFFIHFWEKWSKICCNLFHLSLQ